jgi:hypothetical protein
MEIRKSRSGWALRAAGLTLGFCAVLVVAVSSRVPAGAGTVGADVTFVANPSGELTVSPATPFLRGRALRPSGRTAGGVLGVTNKAGRPVGIELRAATETSKLDGFVRIEIRSASAIIYHGTLAGVRDWVKTGFVLSAGEKLALRFRVWLAPTATRGYEGRYETVPVELRRLDRDRRRRWVRRGRRPSRRPRLAATHRHVGEHGALDSHRGRDRRHENAGDQRKGR